MDALNVVIADKPVRVKHQFGQTEIKNATDQQARILMSPLYLLGFETASQFRDKIAYRKRFSCVGGHDEGVSPNDASRSA